MATRNPTRTGDPTAAPPLPLAKMGAIMALTVLTAWFATYRIAHAGDWLPTLPDRVGVWQATDTPLPADTLRLLGGPQGLGREYNNQFNEPVRVSVIAANGFDAYHDPTVCVSGNGFNLTGVKTFKIDGPDSGEVRAMVFKREDPTYGTIRIVMYYWQQNRDATTASDPVMGTYRDMVPRLRTGAGAVLKGQQTVLVRIYAPIGPEDIDGVQTQRNVHEISRAMYRAMKQSGAEG